MPASRGPSPADEPSIIIQNDEEELTNLKELSAPKVWTFQRATTPSVRDLTPRVHVSRMVSKLCFLMSLIFLIKSVKLLVFNTILLFKLANLLAIR
jgi:hypothetical protein